MAPVQDTPVGPAGIAFRAGTAADRAFVAALAEEAFGHLGPGYGALLSGWLGAAEVATVIATRGDAPLGFSMLGLYAHDAGTRADLLALAVLPAGRRVGVGRALLARAIAIGERCAEDRGTSELRLSVAEDNTPARALFAAAGFAPAPDEASRYEAGQPALRLRRPLR